MILKRQARLTRKTVETPASDDSGSSSDSEMESDDSSQEFPTLPPKAKRRRKTPPARIASAAEGVIPASFNDTTPESSFGSQGHGTPSTNSKISCYETLSLASLRKVRSQSMLLHFTLVESSFVIGEQSAARLLKGPVQLPYHRRMEYPSPTVYRVNKSTVGLDDHVFLLVSHMLYLLARQGMKASGVIAQSWQRVQKMGHFAPGEFLLSAPVMTAFSDGKYFDKLSRVADNWKTIVKNKGLEFVYSLRATFPLSETEENSPVVRDMVSNDLISAWKS